MPPEQGLPLARSHACFRRSFRRRSGERDDRGWTLLHVAARKGDLKEVKRLLNDGMDVNLPAWGAKSRGATPLHLAAQGGHLKVMDELLERGADIDARMRVLVAGPRCTLQPRKGKIKLWSSFLRMVPSCRPIWMISDLIHLSITALASS